jgi:hypothetical protein
MPSDGRKHAGEIVRFWRNHDEKHLTAAVTTDAARQRRNTNRQIHCKHGLRCSAGRRSGKLRIDSGG